MGFLLDIGSYISVQADSLTLISSEDLKDSHIDFAFTSTTINQCPACVRQIPVT